jgi:Trypsin-co-occurring domain 2
MIELADVITELRRELDHAMTEGRDERLRFELGPVELEVTVGLEAKGGASAKVRFLVVELGGDGEVGRSSMQRIKLILHPRLAGSAAPPFVSGEETSRER